VNPAVFSRIKQSLPELRESGLYRQRSSGGDGARLNFSSNDYLSLGSDGRLKQAYQTGYANYPVGSGGSPLVAGYHPVHRQLEQAFSTALGVDDCLFFTSGYAANLSLMALLTRLDARILMDKAVHASIYDGLALAGSKFTRYRHTDLADVSLKLQRGNFTTLVTESVFSMSGQMAPLTELAQLGSQYELDLVVDEAHAFGVMGPEGLGLVSAFKLPQESVPLRVIPLGKAFTGSGAIVAGQGDWINALLQSARPYIYSTAPSPALAYGLLKTLDIIRAADDRRLKLQDLITYFRSATQHSKWTWRDSTTAIQQLQIGCPHWAQQIAEKLLENSIICFPMRQPTVTKQEAGLRVILNAHHEADDIDFLLKNLQIV